jgi:hypothetical protein
MEVGNLMNAKTFNLLGRHGYFDFVDGRPIVSRQLAEQVGDLVDSGMVLQHAESIALGTACVCVPCRENRPQPATAVQS